MRKKRPPISEIREKEGGGGTRAKFPEPRPKKSPIFLSDLQGVTGDGDRLKPLLEKEKTKIARREKQSAKNGLWGGRGRVRGARKKRPLEKSWKCWGANLAPRPGEKKSLVGKQAISGGLETPEN